MSFSEEGVPQVQPAPADAGINSAGDLNEKLLPHEAEKQKGMDRAQQRKALCGSIFAMALSIPALIGA